MFLQKTQKSAGKKINFKLATNKKLGAVLIALSDCYKAFKQKTPE